MALPQQAPPSDPTIPNNISLEESEELELAHEFSDQSESHPNAEFGQPEPGESTEARPEACAELEADSGDHDDSDVNPDAGIEAPNPTTLKAVAAMLQSLADEGLAELAADFTELRETIRQVKGIVLSLDELEAAVAETEKLRRDREFVEREYGLSEADLPIGKRAREHALDAMPWSDDFGPATTQLAFNRLTEVLDRVGMQLADDDGDADQVAAYLSSRDAFKGAISQLEAAGEEPRKVVISKSRLRAWLAFEDSQSEDFNSLQKRTARRLALNLLIAHSSELEQLAKHHANPRRFAPPQLRALMGDVEILQNVLGGRAERLHELFSPSERRKLEKLAPALISYADEISRLALSGAKPLVSLPVANLEAQESIRRAPNFATVFEASKKLPQDLSRILTLHWVAEMAAVQAWENSEKLKDACGPAPTNSRGHVHAPSLGLIVGKASDLGFRGKSFGDAIFERNTICHKGNVWDDEDRFAKIISNYESGISSFCKHFGVDLSDIRVKRVPRQCTTDEIRSRLAETFASERIDFDRICAEVDAQTLEKFVDRLRISNPEFQFKDARGFLFSQVARLCGNLSHDEINSRLRAQSKHFNPPKIGTIAYGLFSKDRDKRDYARSLVALIKGQGRGTSSA